MKKTFSLFLTAIIFCLSFFSLPFESMAVEQTDSIEKSQLGSTDTYYEYAALTRTLTISGEGETPNFSSNGVGAPWYDWRSDSIDNVIVSDGVTTLGNNLLCQVRAKNITLPETLTKIGSYSLAYASGLSDIEFDFGLTSIGSYAFYYSDITNIILPDSLTVIGVRAFQNCDSLSEIVIPYSVKTISSYAFYQCTSLSNVTFESLSSSVAIGASCFLGCSNLKNLIVPMNASMDSYSFGYNIKKVKYSDVSMCVYDGSAAMTYADLSSIEYSKYDSISVQCAVGYANTYTESNIGDSFVYKFTPENDEVYNIYTRGSCDVKCTVVDLYGNIVAQNDDISESDRNFAVSALLKSNEQYTITLSSVKSIGSYTFWIYPDEIKSFSIKGSATANAQKNMTVTDDSLLTSLLLSINFADGIVDYIYYNADFFDGKYLNQYATNLTCGENVAYLSIGNVTAPYNLYINHNYISSNVDYTVDDDGFTLNKCVLCGDEYKTDFVATPAIKITGTAVFAEDRNGNHDNNVPYTFGKIVIYDLGTFKERTYQINSDGTWQINTFNNIDVYIVNDEGKHFCFSYIVDGLEPYTVVERGKVAVFAYDLNNDGKVNAKDYGIYVHDKRDKYGDEYWQFANNFFK